ncbi:Dabb family protein [Celerinatantimonas sp. YJH-8]|uniref:Dabb family protein n=1 Tax=Celerinatantimonas sp. YJH-8 TaxID=3228714 RepID=UPI0038C5BBC5
MLRHFVICPIAATCTPEQFDDVVTQLRSLQAHIPGIPSFSVEKSKGLSNERPGFVLMAEFNTEADWHAYMQNEHHLAIGEAITPFLDVEHMVMTQTDL